MSVEIALALDEMAKSLNTVRAELIEARELIARNERTAVYNYEQYNLLRRENARLTAELEVERRNNIALGSTCAKLRAELEAARKWAAAWKMLAKVWAQMDVHEVYPALKRQFNGENLTPWPGADWRKRK